MNRSSPLAEIPRGKKPQRRVVVRLAIKATAGCALLISLAAIAYASWFFLRPQPKPVDRQLFAGVRYLRDVRTDPRPLVIHRIDIDLRIAHPQFVISHGDGRDSSAHAIRVTTFLHDERCQIAINGGFYELGEHRWTGSFVRAGELVKLVGLAADKGMVYSPARYGFGTLYLSAAGVPSLTAPVGPIYDAISGSEMVVRNGKLSTRNQDEISARTAVGLNATRDRMVIVVIDGKQPGYSEGVTLLELGEILKSFGIFDGLCFDGGGSSTLAVQDKQGQPELLNSPTNLGIVDLERPVGDCLGIQIESAERAANSTQGVGVKSSFLHPRSPIADDCKAVNASAEY
jgi:Phosphodiester glycosidase